MTEAMNHWKIREETFKIDESFVGKTLIVEINFESKDSSGLTFVSSDGLSVRRDKNIFYITIFELSDQYFYVLATYPHYSLFLYRASFEV